ncbi:MAG: pepsin/retropepsin-like aspartic protease family protein [Thermoanaerobaculia bacterium]
MAVGCGLVVALFAEASRAQDCPVFLLHRAEGGLEVVTDSVADGQTGVWLTGGSSEWLDVVLPVAPGLSASLVRKEDRVTQAVRCSQGSLSHSLRGADGREQRREPVSLATLNGEDIRVSAVTPGQEGSVFLISGYATTSRTGGPVQNLFADQAVPAEAGDWFVTTDTRERPKTATLAGEAPFELAGYWFARGRWAQGEGWFVIDTGATRSVLVAGALPAGTPVVPLTVLEESMAGRRELGYTPPGATGPVAGVRGRAQLGELHIGDLHFAAAEFDVLDRLPLELGRPVVGILGLDLLERAEQLTFHMPSPGEALGRLTLSPSQPGPPAAGTMRLPLTRVSEHLVVEAMAGKSNTHLLVDTGSRDLLLEPSAVAAGDVRPDAKAERAAHGLDGGSVPLRTGMLSRLALAGQDLGAVPCVVAELPVLAPLRGGGPVGLLGTAVLARFERVEIDFAQKELRLVPSKAAGGR